LYNSGVEW